MPDEITAVSTAGGAGAAVSSDKDKPAHVLHKEEEAAAPSASADSKTSAEDAAGADAKSSSDKKSEEQDDVKAAEAKAVTDTVARLEDFCDQHGFSEFGDY